MGEVVEEDENLSASAGYGLIRIHSSRTPFRISDIIMRIICEVLLAKPTPLVLAGDTSDVVTPILLRGIGLTVGAPFDFYTPEIVFVLFVQQLIAGFAFVPGMTAVETDCSITYFTD